MSQLLASDGQSIGASASVLPMNSGFISFRIFPLGFPLGYISFRISFRIDWLDLLAVQRTLKSLLQHHSFKALILWCSGFFMVLYALTSIHDYWKNHNFDYVDLCWQSDVSAF